MKQLRLNHVPTRTGKLHARGQDRLQAQLYRSCTIFNGKRHARHEGLNGSARGTVRILGPPSTSAERKKGVTRLAYLGRLSHFAHHHLTTSKQSKLKNSLFIASASSCTVRNLNRLDHPASTTSEF